MPNAAPDEATPPSAPAVTVIIATYNRSNVLPFSIASALLQTLTDFEVLVVGDGCTDNSESVVRSIDDPRVRWINLPANSGHQSAPNNEGLRQARGALVAYLGHDDLWLPDHLTLMVGALEGGADVAHSITKSIDPDPARSRLWLNATYRPGDWMPPSSVVHRRAAAVEVGGWRDYRELDIDPEADLWQRIHAAGGHLAFVPRLTVVKFPAASRQDVYRNLPCHEQAAWLARIRETPDIEAVEIALLLVETEADLARTRVEVPYRRLVRGLLRTTAVRILRRLRPPPVAALGAVVARRRRFKGLTDTP